MRRVLGVVAATLVVFVLAPNAGAHSSGCHAQHSCPSDANPPSYLCGDKGNACSYPNDPANPDTPHLSGPPTDSDCANHPEYYAPPACTGGSGGVQPPSPSHGDGDISGRCGKERWNVKTDADTDRSSVDLFRIVPTTVEALTSVQHPGYLPQDNRIAPIETTVWQVNATFVEYKIEDDLDVHMILRGATGVTMIAEIPNASCVSSASPAVVAIEEVRGAFDPVFQPSSAWHSVEQPITVVGIGFWDFFHNQRGVAPNVVELHPVLFMRMGSMSFGSAVFTEGLAPTPIPTPTPTPSSSTTTPPPSPTVESSPTGTPTASRAVPLLVLLVIVVLGIVLYRRRDRG